MPRKPVVLDQVNLVVKDMQAAVEFYGRLGIELPDTLPEWQAHHREAKGAGGVSLDLDSAAFAPMWCEGWTPGAGGVVVGFRTATREDVDDLYAELTGAGHEGLQPPFDAFWGARYAVVADPSGNPIGLMSPMDASKRTAPPDPPK